MKKVVLLIGLLIASSNANAAMWGNCCYAALCPSQGGAPNACINPDTGQFYGKGNCEVGPYGVSCY